jgi:hypothetical protein
MSQIHDFARAWNPQLLAAAWTADAPFFGGPAYFALARDTKARGKSANIIFRRRPTRHLFNKDQNCPNRFGMLINFQAIKRLHNKGGVNRRVLFVQIGKNNRVPISLNFGRLLPLRGHRTQLKLSCPRSSAPIVRPRARSLP